ncbi:MAG: hypothetical protein AAF502_21615 [Bacteroidota bacterium]
MRYITLIIFSILSLHSCSQENEVLWTVAWSHDDAYIAVGGNQGDLKLFDGKTFEFIKSYPVKDVILSRLKWHPYQHKLAVITQSETFKAKILDLGKDQWVTLKGLQNSFRALDWNHSGEYLALSEFEGPVSIFDLEGNQISRFKADQKGAAGLDWHPSKNILTTAGSQIGIYTLEGDTLHRFEPHETETFMLCVEWHKSGDFFAVGDYGDLKEAKNKLVQFWTIEGQLITQLEGSIGEYRNIRWSPDGEKLATASDALRIWNKKGELISESASFEAYLWGIDWNSKGDKIIATDANGVISIWDKEANLLKKLKH